MFRFRMGLMIGFAVGYVLGTKAGRERYRQLQELWQQVSGSKPAQQIGSEVRTAAGRAGQVIEDKAAEGVSKVTSLTKGDDAGSPSGRPGGASL